MRSASGRSFSFNGRIVISIAVICPIFRRRGSKRRAESVIEIREVAEARVQSDVQHRLGGGSETQGRFTQPSSQNELMGREADDMLEGSQEIVGTDPDERAQLFKAQRPPEMLFDKPNRRRDSALIPHRRPLHRNWRSTECGQDHSGQFQREFFKIDRSRSMQSELRQCGQRNERRQFGKTVNGKFERGATVSGIGGETLKERGLVIEGDTPVADAVLMAALEALISGT